MVHIKPNLENFRKKIIEFNPQYPISLNDTLPCGQCLSCRLHYMHEWGIRCEQEALMHSDNHFVNLTYAPEFLPASGSLCQKDLTLFIKRVRFHFFGRHASSIRYFACGEYGKKEHRPHYHIIFFGLPLTDLFYFTTIKKIRYYRSLALEELWGKGHILIGPVNYESAAYTAGYCLKKQKGRTRTFSYKDLSAEKPSSFKADLSRISYPVADYKPKTHLLRKGKLIADLSTAHDFITGEILFPDLLDVEGNALYDPLDTDITILDDEFSTMSRNPGIGIPFYQKYKKTMFRNGFIVHKNKKCAIPKAYLTKYFAECSDAEFIALQAARQRYRDTFNTPDFTPEALRQKMIATQKRFNMFSNNRYL